jgi:HSP20 family protein
MADADTQLSKSPTMPPQESGSRLNPFERLRHEVERLFDEFTLLGSRPPARTAVTPFQPFHRVMDLWSRDPASDLIERDGEYEIQVELPGLEVNDIDVKLHSGILMIKGEKTEEHTEKADDYHMRERSYGILQRHFRMPEEIDAANVTAKLENGVLTVRLPKSGETKSAERSIRIETS